MGFKFVFGFKRSPGNRTVWPLRLLRAAWPLWLLRAAWPLWLLCTTVIFVISLWTIDFPVATERSQSAIAITTSILHLRIARVVCKNEITRQKEHFEGWSTNLSSTCRPRMTKEYSWQIINMSDMPFCHWQAEWTYQICFLSTRFYRNFKESFYSKSTIRHKSVRY